MAGAGKRLGAIFFLLSLAGSMNSLPAAPLPKGTTPTFDQKVEAEKMVNYLRRKFYIPGKLNLSFGEFRSYKDPGFFASTLTIDDGKEKHTQEYLVTQDGRCMILAVSIPMADPAAGGDLKGKVLTAIRAHFKLPADMPVDMAPFKESPVPGYLSTVVSVGEGVGRQSQDFTVSKNGDLLLQSAFYRLGSDPQAENARLISLHDQPFQGGANAPVTIVEYADLECPMCARLHEFLETKVVPKYGNRIRVFYKEFPLVTIHDWSLTAAIGTQCAYTLSPSTFVPLRTMIFANQQMLTAANIRDMVLTYGERAGLDRAKLASCLDSQASMPRVLADMAEGQKLGVSRTPTCYINGRPYEGLASEEDFYKAIDDALSASAKP
jgi:protein-disulfide isomerase